MSDHYPNTSGEPMNVSDEQLDRLVDGELERAEYRRLLAALDNQPEGWRRCEMAFLESQALGHDMMALDLASPDWADCVSQGSPPTVLKTTSGLSSRWSFWTVVAASFLVAFVLGLTWRHGWSQLSPPEITRSSPQQPVVDQNRFTEVTSAAPTDSITDAGNTPRNNAWGQITLIVDGDDGTAQEVSLPVFKQQGLQDDWFEKMAVVPPHIQRDLRRLGYQARRDVSWAPVELQGGQRVFFPMSEFEITPVSMLFQ